MLPIYLFTFMLVGVSQTEAVPLAPPGGLRFNSTNLHNIVVWNPGTPDTRYTLEYAIYGDGDVTLGDQVRWREVRECTMITRNSCDLSDQTHSLNQAYYARVQALGTAQELSDWTTSRRFEPRLDTAIGPPQVNVHVSGNSLAIDVWGPMRWKNRNMKKERAMRNVMEGILYNISLHDNATKHTRHFITENQSYSLGSLEYETVYCISVGTHSEYAPLHTQASPWHCQKTAADPVKASIPILLSGLLPSAISVFILILACWLVYHYIYGNKQKQPHSTIISPSASRFVHPSAVKVQSTLVSPLLADDSSTLPSGDELVSAVAVGAPPAPARAPGPPLPPALAPPSQPSNLAPVPQPPKFAFPPPPMSDSPPPSYAAQQHVSRTHTLLPAWMSTEDVPEEDASSVLLAEEEEEEHEFDDLPPDYGLVVRNSRQDDGESNVPVPPPTPLMTRDVYRAQGANNGQWGPTCHNTNTNADDDGGDNEDDDEEEDDDEDNVNGPTRVDWNPSTGVLHIPELGPMLEVRRDTGEENKGEQTLPNRDLFSSLVVRQPSQDSNETEDGLSQMEMVWQLQVNMEE